MINTKDAVPPEFTNLRKIFAPGQRGVKNYLSDVSQEIENQTKISTGQSQLCPMEIRQKLGQRKKAVAPHHIRQQKEDWEVGLAGWTQIFRCRCSSKGGRGP